MSGNGKKNGKKLAGLLAYEDQVKRAAIARSTGAYVDLASAAAYVGLSPMTLRRRINPNYGKAGKPVGKPQIRFLRAGPNRFRVRISELLEDLNGLRKPGRPRKRA